MFADLQNKYIDLYFFFLVFQLNFYFAQYGLLQSKPCTMIDVLTNSIEANFGRHVSSNTMMYVPFENDTNDHSLFNRSSTNHGVSISGGIGIFNGSSYIDMGSEERTKFQKYSNGTISVRFKITGRQGSGQNAYVIGKARMHPATQSNILYGIGFQSDGKLVAGVFPGNNRSPTPVPYGSTIQLSLNTRYNIVLTKSGTTKKVYINGNIVASGSAQDTTSTDNPPLTIGSATYYNSNSYITGNISRAIMEDITRNDTEIVDDFNKTKSKYGY